MKIHMKELVSVFCILFLTFHLSYFKLFAGVTLFSRIYCIHLLGTGSSGSQCNNFEEPRQNLLKSRERPSLTSANMLFRRKFQISIEHCDKLFQV